MRALITFTHQDESSGTTIMDDGTKVYWTEGFSSPTIVYPDGQTEQVDTMSGHPVINVLDGGLGAMRAMTAPEIAEYDMMTRG